MSKKTLAKTLSIIFVLIAISTCCVAFAVSAAGLSANVNDETAYRGDTVTFNATLSESVEVGSGSLALSYDSDVLELVSGTCNVSGAMLSNFDVAKGKGAFAFSGTGTVSGNLFTVTFRIKDNAAFGTTNVSLDVTLKDGSNAVISLTNNNGTITVNCNHSFTKEDTTYLKSEATCTSPAVYYKSCVTCGAKGTDTFEYGSTEPHAYTRQVITDAYKVSGATCTAKAVYNYCCVTCDAKGTTTFEYGSTLAHSYTRQVIEDTYKVSDADCDSKAVYNYCCSDCDAKGTATFEYGSILGHTGGTATCTAKAECTRCHQPYGSMLEHVYTAEDATATYLKSAATCTSKAVYYKNCATCDKAGTATFEYGALKAHSYAEKVEDAYLKSGATCTSKAVYYKSCSACGVKGTETFEVGDAPSHNYQTTWSSNETSHWHECSKCGDKKDTASHTAGAAATESTAQTCTVCGYVITPALGHTHNYGSEWLSNATEHWHKCGGCSSTKDNAPHDYTNACDTDCDTCGHTREITHSYKTEWSSNEEQHWYECSVCGDKSSEANHIPGAEATETTDQVCTVCNYVMQEALGHTHNYNSSKNDETNHWKECACGEKAEVSQHTWNDGEITKEPTVDEEGVKTYTCTVCGHSKDESIAKLPPQTDTPPTTDEPNENDGLSGGAIAGIAVGSTAVVAVGGFSLFWFVIKKKKFADLIKIFAKK